MKSTDSAPTAGRIAACPQCGRSTRLDARNQWRPFCSERCKLIDLGAWFSGDRSIPDHESSVAAPTDPQD